MSWFVTGTDTGVGKTYVTARIVAGLRATGCDAVACKPVASGGREDAGVLAAASGGLPLDLVNPVWFSAPLAPWVAGLLEGRSADPAVLVGACRALMARHEIVFVEGVGGWEAPLAPGFTVADLAAQLDLPVIIVAANRLGALNHCRLTVAAIRARGLPCAGIILNQLDDLPGLPGITNKGVIAEFTGVPLLAHVIHGQDGIEFSAAGACRP